MSIYNEFDIKIINNGTDKILDEISKKSLNYLNQPEKK
jgi:hypothetical protein